MTQFEQRQLLCISTPYCLFFLAFSIQVPKTSVVKTSAFKIVVLQREYFNPALFIKSRFEQNQ